MKAPEVPDKIYVNFPFGEEHPWRGPMVTKQGLNRSDTIYIRKDCCAKGSLAAAIKKYDTFGGLADLRKGKLRK